MLKIIISIVAFILSSSIAFSQHVDTVAVTRFSTNETVISYQEPSTHLTISIRSVVCDSIKMKVVVTNTTMKSIGILKFSTIVRSFNIDTCYYWFGYNPNDFQEFTHVYTPLEMYVIPRGDSLIEDIKQSHCNFFDLSVTICGDVEKLKNALRDKNKLHGEVLRKQKTILQIDELVDRETNFFSVEFDRITPQSRSVKVSTY